jgi:hypothetical protein
MLEIPLAYKFVVTAAMISQVNYYAPRLHLPIDVPVKENEIQFLNFNLPIDETNFHKSGGCIIVKNYEFTFNDRLDILCKLENDGLESLGIPMAPMESAGSGMERASRMKYSVSTNDIYNMATNWLVVLNINVEKLEKVNYPIVNECPLFHSDRGWVPNPLLLVDWKNTNSPGYDETAVQIQISAVSGELLKFSDGNGFFGKQSTPLIKDLGKLLDISDDKFLKYSDKERSNLVFRFAGVHLRYPVLNKSSSSATRSVFHPRQCNPQTF